MRVPHDVLAQIFVSQYALDSIPHVSFLAHTHNIVYLVSTAQGAYVLRIHPQTALPRLQREVAILTRLHGHGLAIPQAISTPNNRLIVHHDEFIAVLLTYLEGETRPANALTEDDCRACGAFLGHLHNLNVMLDEPHRLNTDGLLGGEGATEAGLYQLYIEAWLNTQEYTVVSACRRLIAPILDQSEHIGLIHGDFLLHNILFEDKRVKALDWEYSANGVYLYDLAPLLWQLKPQANYGALALAYTRAYYDVRPHMRSQHALLEKMIMARHLASIRWVAHNADNPMIAPNAVRIIAHRVKELDDFLQQGVLHRTNFVP
jgi:Ser/Thr protein kinase RdoA (MazF antagonist)